MFQNYDLHINHSLIITHTLDYISYTIFIYIFITDIQYQHAMNDSMMHDIKTSQNKAKKNITN